MQSGAEIYQSFRLADQRGEDVGRQCVDREYVRQSVHRGDPARLAIAYAGVVNYCIESSERVDLVGDLPAFRDAGEIAGNSGLRSGDRGQRFLRSLLVSRVQNDAMAILDHEPSGHQSEA